MSDTAAAEGAIQRIAIAALLLGAVILSGIVIARRGSQ